AEGGRDGWCGGVGGRTGGDGKVRNGTGMGDTGGPSNDPPLNERTLNATPPWTTTPRAPRTLSAATPPTVVVSVPRERLPLLPRLPLRTATPFPTCTWVLPTTAKLLRSVPCARAAPGRPTGGTAAGRTKWSLRPTPPGWLRASRWTVCDGSGRGQ